MSTFKEPYRVEGKKIMGYEIAESFNWKLPDVIIYPTGGGTGLVGMWKAFHELEALGWLESEYDAKDDFSPGRRLCSGSKSNSMQADQLVIFGRMLTPLQLGYVCRKVLPIS